MKLNNINYLNMPQQVEANKQAIVRLEASVFPLATQPYAAPLEGVTSIPYGLVLASVKVNDWLIGTDNWAAQITHIDTFYNVVTLASNRLVAITGPQGPVAQWQFIAQTNDAPVGIDLTNFSEVLIVLRQGYSAVVNYYSQTYPKAALEGHNSTPPKYQLSETAYCTFNAALTTMSISGDYAMFTIYGK